MAAHQEIEVDSMPIGGCATSVRAYASLSVLTGALAAALVTSTIASAEPGCAEFRNPATGACEPYVVTSEPEYSGESAFLSESDLFAGSASDDVLDLGYSICRSMERGTPPREIAREMVSGGIDAVSAATVVNSAQKWLC